MSLARIPSIPTKVSRAIYRYQLVPQYPATSASYPEMNKTHPRPTRSTASDWDQVTTFIRTEPLLQCYKRCADFHFGLRSLRNSWTLS